MINRLFFILASTIFITACNQADTPQQIAKKYWDALKAGDQQTARQLVSSTTQQNFDAYVAQQGGQKDPINKVELSDERASVTTAVDIGDSPARQRSTDTILIMENGEWKIDAFRTQHPSSAPTTQDELNDFTNQLSDSMNENMESMDEALTEGMDLLNEALRDGSKEMSNSLLDAMKKMNEAMRESIDKMKERKKAKPDYPAEQDSGEGMI